jgi:hypothetical protein
LAFEQNPGLGWKFAKFLLKCILSTKESIVVDKSATAKEDSSASKVKDNAGSRTNHQRLQAVELFGILLKECQTNTDSREALLKYIPLLSSVIVKVVQSADQW